MLQDPISALSSPLPTGVPAAPQPPTRVFHYEQVTYGVLDVEGATDVVSRAYTNPAEAVRTVRAAVRALATTLPAAERRRALHWVEHGGSLGALAALHRGEPCGFSLSHRERWIEWTIHPLPRAAAPAQVPDAEAGTGPLPRRPAAQRPESDDLRRGAAIPPDGPSPLRPPPTYVPSHTAE
jgi:hypothetical protein